MRDYALETTFDVKFTTRRFTTGVPFALASGVISAYPGNSTTQITAGITLSVDFDGVAGLNNIRVVATAANGYATNTNYALVITTGTVDSVSVVGEVVGEFSIEAQSPLRPTVAARTLDVSAGGEAGVDWANIGSPTTAQNLSATNIDVDQVVASVSGAVGSVTGLTAATVHSDLDDIQARLPAALSAGGNIKADVLSLGGVVQSLTDLKDFADDGYDPATNKVQGVVLVDTLTTYTGNTVQTGDSFARIGVAGAGLTNIDLPNQTMDITGNLSGSVGSVTGAVGSVTGLTAATVHSDLDDIQARLPAALTANGNMKSSLMEILTTALTETAGQIAAAFKQFFDVASPTGTMKYITRVALVDTTTTNTDMRGTDNAALAANLNNGTITLHADYDAAKTAASQTSVNTIDDLLDSEIPALTTELAKVPKSDSNVTFNATALASINSEVVDALNVDTYAEPTGVPAATASLVAKIGRLHQALRNQVDVTATKKTFYNDAGTAIWEKDLADAAGTYSESEGNTP